MGAGGSSRSGVSSEAASRQRARSFGILCTEPVAPSPRPHPRFAALVDDCMAPDPGARPTFEEVLGRLEEVEGAGGGGGRRE